MNGRKPAQLTGDLLSRKGTAMPSAAPPARGNQVNFKQAPAPRDPKAYSAPESLTDWIPPTKRKLPKQTPKRSPSRSSEQRVRVSLRLDTDRHMRMKLVATHMNCTLQSLFTQAIDEFFERHTPDVADAVALLRPGRNPDAGGD